MDSEGHPLLTHLLRDDIICNLSLRDDGLALIDSFSVRHRFEILSVDRSVQLIADFREYWLGQAHAHRVLVAGSLRNGGCHVHCARCIDGSRRVLHIVGIASAQTVIAQLLTSNYRSRPLHAAIFPERSKRLEAFLPVEACVFDGVLRGDLVTLVEHLTTLVELFRIAASRLRSQQPL